MPNETNNEPAFPQSKDDNQFCSGMTLRDYFAGQAMTSLLSLYYDRGQLFADQVTEQAYQMADAMMEARK
jgi:hypothetical protein